MQNILHSMNSKYYFHIFFILEFKLGNHTLTKRHRAKDELN